MLSYSTLIQTDFGVLILNGSDVFIVNEMRTLL